MNAPGDRTHATRDAIAWLAAYLAVVAVPLFALLPGPATGHGFAWDLAMALGYAAIAMLGVQFALTARFRRATAPFGIDIVYYFHRYLAVYAVAIAIAHAATVMVQHPSAAGVVDPREAPAHMTAGRVALLLLVALIATSLARKALRLDYEPWRTLHLLLAATAFLLSVWHAFDAGHLLDTPWKRGLWAAFAGFWMALLAYTRLLRPWRVSGRPWRVVEVRPERGRVHTLVLAPAGPSTPPLRFLPGQFAWLSLRASPFAMREHPFSIASSSEHGDRVELAIKAVGDFTATIASVRADETAFVDAAYGNFSIDRHPDAPGYVFVAGGIGIAPVLSMLRTLADRGDRRPLVLFYGNRAWDRVAFREELESLSLRLDLRVVHVLLEPPPQWTGGRGHVDEEILMHALLPTRHRLVYFLCGPTAMTRSVEQHLATLGVPASRVHSEIFDWV